MNENRIIKRRGTYPGQLIFCPLTRIIIIIKEKEVNSHITVRKEKKED